MKTRQAILVGLLLTAAMLVYSLILYPQLPDRVPLHWNLRGQVDGWGSKGSTLFLMPGFMLLMVGMIVALPAMSPRNYSIEPFLPTFNYVMVVVFALMAYEHVVILQATLHPGLDPERAMMGGTFLFFALIGNVMGKVRPNFWMGVRTPWTLASNAVWVATHRLAGRLMVVIGIGGSIAAWLGVPMMICTAALLVAAFYPVVYSYILYLRLEGGGRP